MATTGARASSGMIVIYSARIYSGVAQRDLLSATPVATICITSDNLVANVSWFG